MKEQTKGKVRLGAVDATVHQVVSSRYGVSVNAQIWTNVTDFKANKWSDLTLMLKVF